MCIWTKPSAFLDEAFHYFKNKKIKRKKFARSLLSKQYPEGLLKYYVGLLKYSGVRLQRNHSRVAEIVFEAH